VTCDVALNPNSSLQNKKLRENKIREKNVRCGSHQDVSPQDGLVE